MSRLKSRKVLGVGNSNGGVTISKVGQILGNFAQNGREQDMLVIWWLRIIGFILALSVLISAGGTKCLQEEACFRLFTTCAFKLGVSLALVFASFQSHEEAILVAIVLVLGVFSFNTVVSFAIVWYASTGVLECGFNFGVLAISYLIFRGMMLWSPSRNSAV